MKFSVILSVLKIKATNIRSADYCIGKITSNTDDVERGDVFVCIKGSERDGHDYIQKAYIAGARTIIAERVCDFMRTCTDIRYVIVDDTRKAECDMQCVYYQNPAKDMTVVAVTGTNGKTTVSYAIRSVLTQASRKVGLIGTVNSFIGNTPIGEEFDTMTTPPPSVLFKILREMKLAGVDTVILEASSHALVQKRLEALDIDLGIFTNLSEDHLDYHITREKYREAKAHLFDLCKNALICTDQDDGKIIFDLAPCKKYSFGLNDECDYVASAPVYLPSSVSYVLKNAEKSQRVLFNMPGDISVYNSLAASAACDLLGISQKDIAIGLENMPPVPGRLELIYRCAGKKVYIDYAHTPEALEKVLCTLNVFKQRRLITLFGCGGNREREKRAKMGEIASRLSDIVIVSADNSRNENTPDIINDIMAGVTDCEKVQIIPDRKSAIIHALDISMPGDTLLLAGKGHECYEINGDTKTPFSERDIVNDYYTQKQGTRQ